MSMVVADEKMLDVASQIDDLTDNFALPSCDGVQNFTKALTTASAIAMLKRLLTDQIVNDLIMPLQNSRLGFRTDKPGGYPVHVVKECAIEAVLRGASLAGNQWNIIAGNCYMTKEYFEDQVRNRLGCSEVDLEFGELKSTPFGCQVPCKLSWKNPNGEAEVLERPVVVRVNQGQIVDAIFGKATRKIFAIAYQKITQRYVPDADVDDAQVVIDATPAKPAVTGPPVGRTKAPSRNTRTQQQPAATVSDADEFPDFDPKNGNGNGNGHGSAAEPVGRDADPGIYDRLMSAPDDCLTAALEDVTKNKTLDECTKTELGRVLHRAHEIFAQKNSG